MAAVKQHFNDLLHILIILHVVIFVFLLKTRFDLKGGAVMKGKVWI